MNERERKHNLELLETAIGTLQASMESLKDNNAAFAVDLDNGMNTTYTCIKVDLTVYHDWSDET